MFVLHQGRLACFLCLEVLLFPFVVDGGAGLGEGGRDVGCHVLEGDACVANGDAREVETSQISSYGARRG